MHHIRRDTDRHTFRTTHRSTGRSLLPRLGLLALLSLLLLGGCSDSAEDANQQGSLEKKQDEIAQQAIDYMKTPLDQARKAAEQSNSHTKAVEEGAGQQ